MSRFWSLNYAFHLLPFFLSSENSAEWNNKIHGNFPNFLAMHQVDSPPSSEWIKYISIVCLRNPPTPTQGEQICEFPHECMRTRKKVDKEEKDSKWEHWANQINKSWKFYSRIPRLFIQLVWTLLLGVLKILFHFISSSSHKLYFWQFLIRQITFSLELDYYC